MDDMDDVALDLVHRRLSRMLERASELFKPGFKVTFIARNPENDEQDFLVTDDTIAGLEALLLRMQDRERARALDEGDVTDSIVEQLGGESDGAG